MNNYRNKIYEKYAFLMHDSKPLFDEAAAQHWGRAYDTFLKGWLPKNKNTAILDIGCGGGRLLYFFKTRGFLNLQGVDISPEQVKLARQVIDNVIEGDVIEYLNSQVDSFDLIIGLDLIEHLNKDEALCFLEACYRALRSKGRLILQTPNAESPWGGNVICGDLTHELSFTPHNLKKLLELFNFTQIEYRQTGPVVHNILSFGRFLIWKIIWSLLALWNLAETGSIGSGIYTRTFLISATKT